MEKSLSPAKHVETLKEFQEHVDDTSLYPRAPNLRVGSLSGNTFALYPFLKLAGEVGEVSEKVGKIIRDKNGIATLDDLNAIMLELGDVLWYMTACANELGFSLEDVATNNVRKLQSRAARGKLQGEGDNR